MTAAAAIRLAAGAAMTVTALIWFLLIGLIDGWLAGQVMRGGGHGMAGVNVSPRSARLAGHRWPV